MKTSILLILFALATTSASEPVLDTDGNAVIPGGKYYVLPASTVPGRGGGVFQGTTDNSECPLTVLQDYRPSNRLPVRLTQTIQLPTIDTGTPLDIEFAEIITGPCSRPTKWLVFESDVARYVGTGYLSDHPNANRITPGTFEIETYGTGYKLVFCAFHGPPVALCYDIGRKDDEGGRRLVLIDQSLNEPYQIEFKEKVDDDANNGLSIV